MIPSPSEMKILVCAKQVPCTESDFKINPEGDGYDERNLVFVTNRYDEYALEEAARIREKFGDVEITTLTVGPTRAESTARRGLEFGATGSVHIITPERTRLDALQTASLIASYARDKHFDLFLFGIMSEDAQRGQTGPMTAALLRLPYATAVISEEIADGRDRVACRRELEGGAGAEVELPLPAVLTIQSGINRPRYPTLTNKLRAKKQEIEKIDMHDFAPPPKNERVVRAYLPPPAREGVFLEGAMEDKVDALVRIIREKTSLL